MIMPALMVVDWGSSSFRAILLDENSSVIDVQRSSDGVLRRTKTGFAEMIESALTHWRLRTGDVPILLSGMIGSRNGWVEVPYVECPATVSDIAGKLFRLEHVNSGHAWIAPGLAGRTPWGARDVMRGEEVQLAGVSCSEASSLVVLPGTHSKWVRLVDGEVSSFATSMTGEMFAMLQKSGSLAGLLTDGGDWDSVEFEIGLNMVELPGGLAHQLFSLRCGCVLGDMTGGQAWLRLSGLLIGHELRAMTMQFDMSFDKLYIIADPAISRAYTHAFALRGQEAVSMSGEQAVAKGAMVIARAAGLLRSGEK